MKDIMKYKDFLASVHFSQEDKTFYGKILGINDLITFEGETVKKLDKAFKEAADDYVELCKLTGKKIHKSYKGSFNVRILPGLHQKAAQLALQENISFNQLIQRAIENEINRAMPE